MTEDWLTPDEDEWPPTRARHGFLPVLTIGDRRAIAYRVRHVLLLARGEHQQAMEALGRAYGVTGRTARRYHRSSYPCPGPRCMTLVRGGGLCTFCRRVPLYGEPG